jgi:hypothetical protein
VAAGATGGFRGRQAQVQEIGLEAVAVDVVGFAPDGRFPTCRHCKGISFELTHAAKHVGEIDHLEEVHAPAQ